MKWGRLTGIKRQRPDQPYFARGLAAGNAFTIDIAKNAPPDGNHRILVTPILQDMDAGSQARISLRPPA